MWYQFILQVHDVDDKKLIEGIHKFLLAHIGICYNIGIVVYNYTTCPWLHYDLNFWDPLTTRIFFSENSKNDPNYCDFFYTCNTANFWHFETRSSQYSRTCCMDIRYAFNNMTGGFFHQKCITLHNIYLSEKTKN